MSTQNLNIPVFHALDENGQPVPGAKLYTYQNGTTTPLATYKVPTFTVGQENTNPIIADAAGRFNAGTVESPPIFLQNAAYTLRCVRPDESVLWQRNDYSPISTANTSFIKRDGTQSPTANTSWNGYRLVSLGTPVDNTDADTKGARDTAIVAALSATFTVDIPNGSGDFPGSNTLETVKTVNNTRAVSGTGTGFLFKNFTSGGNDRGAFFGQQDGTAQIWAQDAGLAGGWSRAFTVGYAGGTWEVSNVQSGSGNFGGGNTIQVLSALSNDYYNGTTSGAGIALTGSNSDAGNIRDSALVWLNGTLQGWAAGGFGNPWRHVWTATSSPTVAEFNPGSDAGTIMGKGSLRWGEITTSTAVVVTSDARRKKNITDIDRRLLRAALNFRLQQFYWNDPATKDERLQVGYIAQEIMAALEEQGLDWRDSNLVTDSGEIFSVNTEAVSALANLARTLDHLEGIAE